jgi:CBS-domain-containing membrane protein
MTHDVVSLQATETVRDALLRLAASGHEFHAFPVFDSDQKLAGLLTCHELRSSNP